MDEHLQTRKAEIAGLYNRVATTYDNVGPAVFAHFGRRLVELAGISDSAKVLDVAAGRGANLFPAAEKVGVNGRVIGIDVAEKMVEETNKEIQCKNLQNATMIQMDAENLTFDDASFDYALCSFALFFFPHLDRALSEFFRVLRPGGTLAVTIPGGDDERWQWFGGLLTDYSASYHFPLTATFPRDGLERTVFQEHLARIGFEDIRFICEETEIIYPDEENWWQSQWTHGVRYPLEHMPPEVLKTFEAEVKTRIISQQEDDGYHEWWRIQCVLARKPL